MTERRPWYTVLYIQVLIAILIGVALGHFYPKTGTAMKPGGMYAASLGTRSIIFMVDPRAQGGATPIIGRLVRLE